MQKLARYQAKTLNIVPASIRVFEKALSSPDQRIRLQAAAKILEGAGILSRGGIEQTVALANQASSPAHGDERVRGIVGDIVEMTIEKSRSHAISLPEEMVRLLPNGEAASGRPMPISS